MSCNITQGITTGCNNSIGGIQQVFIANGYTAYIESGGQITSFTGVAEWFEFDVDNGGASFTETYEVNQNGNLLGFRQSVTLQLNGLDAAIQTIVREMAESTSMVVVVKDNNNSYWTLGIDRGAFLETGSSTTGTAYTDIKAATLTITGIEQESTKLVSPVAVGNTDQFSIWYQWDELDACNNGSQLVVHDFRFGTYNNAKCEINLANAYLLADPLGCYPAKSSNNAGKALKVPAGTTLGVGVEVYDFNGGPYNQNVVFWYRPPGAIGPFYDNGTNWEVSPDVIIGEISNSVITKWNSQSNVTC